MDPDSDAETSADAEASSSEEDDQDCLLQSQIAADIHANINHKPVKAPPSKSPFGEPVHEALFFTALNDITTAGLIPIGYGLTPQEWDDDGYPTIELTTYGCRKKEIVVALLAGVWLPRAVAWGQGLHVMQTLMYTLANE